MGMPIRKIHLDVNNLDYKTTNVDDHNIRVLQ
jgi:hypothetical protein